MGWADGWKDRDGWIVGWMVEKGWMDGQRDKRIDEWMNG